MMVMIRLVLMADMEVGECMTVRMLGMERGGQVKVMKFVTGVQI
jgi:hypothetical protein